MRNIFHVSCNLTHQNDCKMNCKIREIWKIFLNWAILDTHWLKNYRCIKQQMSTHTDIVSLRVKLDHSMNNHKLNKLNLMVTQAFSSGKPLNKLLTSSCKKESSTKSIQMNWWEKGNIDWDNEIWPPMISKPRQIF